MFELDRTARHFADDPDYQALFPERVKPLALEREETKEDDTSNSQGRSVVDAHS